MRLILVRHAKAEERDPAAWPDDGLRPLTPEGRAVHRRVARALARMDLGVEQILSSPLVRARETAEITSAALGLEAPPRFLEELGHGYGVPALTRVLEEHGAGAVLAAVGHEPHLSDFTAAMLDPRGAVAVEFKKSGVLALDFPGRPKPGAGVLRFYFPPKQLLAALGE